MFCFVLFSYKKNNNNTWMQKRKGMSWIGVKEEWNLKSLSLWDLMLIEWLCQTATDSLKIIPTYV